MSNYVDITILPREAQSAPVILSAIVGKLHSQLVSRHNRGDVGLSFPRAEKKYIGDRLRLHGSSEILTSILASDELKRLKDYCCIGSVKTVPAEHGWRYIRRTQPGITAAKVRRLVARGSVTEEQAHKIINDRSVHIEYPYLQMRSSSSGQRYKLFVEQSEVEQPSQDQQFNSFGLGGCVPWF